MNTRIAVTLGGALLALVVGVGCSGASTPDSSTPPAYPTAPTTRPTTPATVPVTTKPVSVEQQNASKAASDYLDGQAFSRKGLISQLKFEGYSTAASTAAVDGLHADWNQQAALVAKSYLDGQAFSRKSLIDQLVFDGFTHDQAVYGTTKAGL